MIRVSAAEITKINNRHKATAGIPVTDAGEQPALESANHR
jgi:hypothetical protein